MGGGEVAALCLSRRLEWQSRERASKVGQPCFHILFWNEVDLIQDQNEFLALDLNSLFLDLAAPRALWISGIQNLYDHVALADHISQALGVQAKARGCSCFVVVRPFLSPVAIKHLLLIQGSIRVGRVG